MENLFGDKQIKVVRHVGDLNSAYLEEDGTTVYRRDEIIIPAIDRKPEDALSPESVAVPEMHIKCAPYDNHFVYRHVYRKNGIPVRGWTTWCTCGSPAFIVGYDGYFNNGSDQGQMVVCAYHSQYGLHMDGSK